MLYQLHEAQHASLAPLRLWAQVTAADFLSFAEKRALLGLAEPEKPNDA